MIRHWKSFDLEITDIENQHDPTFTAENKPSPTLNP